MQINNNAQMIKPGMEKAFFEALRGRTTKSYWEECKNAGKNIPKEKMKKLKEMF